MSVSKLECLPNEILIELFEKYMNGVDILIGFGFLNHHRFYALISQCHRFSFDFRNCPKTHFRSCLGYLRNHFAGKIEQLILSERNTPGQTQQFFSFFPSFFPFKRLRHLHLHIYSCSSNLFAITTALHSLSTIAIETISIDIINTEIVPTLNNAINDIIALRTLKRLSFTSDHRLNILFPITVHSSRVEYLKYSDTLCGFPHLSNIFRCASHLKALDIQLFSESYLNQYYALDPWPDQLLSIPNLRTVILSFMPENQITLNMLEEYLKLMPALQRLEIKAHELLLDANAWESLLKTSLPSLTHFRLRSTKSRIAQAKLEDILASFETPFWVEKKNFYLIITDHRKLSSNGFYIQKTHIENQDEFSQPVVQWWIVPTRARIDDIPTKDIVSFGVTNVLRYLSDYYYFKNIKHLIVYNLNSNLLECLVKSVNYLGIEHLDVSTFDHESDTMSLLLPYLKNIISLRIEYQHLLAHQKIYSKKSTILKYLDISANEHCFSDNDISTISKLFPELKHLAINTNDLSNVPLLKIHLPYLCSLTFAINNWKFSLDHNLDYQLSQQIRLLFQRNDKWMTVWIDEIVLDESYWKRFH